MTPQQLLVALEALQKVATTEPLQDGMLRAAQSAQDVARGRRLPVTYRVRNDGRQIDVDAPRGGIAALRTAYARQKPSIEADYRNRMQRAVQP
jgi:hypothetical protein